MPIHTLTIVLDMPTAIYFAMMAATLIVGIVFSIPLALIWTYHKRKMEEIRLKRQGMMTEEVRAEFAALRAELASLRDTSMQYDLSFDTSLQRLERRVEHVERQSRLQPEAPPQESVSLGGRG